MDLGDEEMMIPIIQADNTPPGDQAPQGEHVGEHVRFLAKALPDLVDAKLNTEVSMDALTQFPLSACTADVAAWEEDGFVRGGENTVAQQITSGAIPESPENGHGRPTEDADAKTGDASVPRRGNRRNSWEARGPPFSWKKFGTAPEATKFYTKL